jgi:hypothetical protein
VSVSKREHYNLRISLEILKDRVRSGQVGTLDTQGDGLLFHNSSSYPTPLVKRVLATSPFSWLLAFVLACLACSPAYADVGVVLNESLDTSVARITGSGHSAVYFSRICPESPVKLRLCLPGEQGSVVSNYTTLGEDQPFEWNVVPLNIYLYGVEDPRYRPLFGSQKIKRVLEERYRAKYLSAYCDSESCRTSNKAEWREMVGATISRSMYMFVVETTVEQDLALIEQFNALPNQNHFNGMTRNCADFTRRVINTYFPNATGPDYLNDFGMTTPKAIARSFTRYAHRHPETRFRVLHFAQVPGTIKRSSECRGGTEQLVRSKKLLVPMIIFADHVLPFVAASYILTGRFNPQRELEEHPTSEATEVEHQLRRAKAGNDDARIEQLEAEKSLLRARIVGTSEEWKQYRTSFDSMVADGAGERSVRQNKSLKKFFRRLDEAGTPVADHNGALWMEFSERGESSRVGLSASNLFSSGTDSELAYDLLLARIGHVLKSPKHSRENMAEFKRDWTLLQSVRSDRTGSVVSATTPTTGLGDGILPASE